MAKRKNCIFCGSRGPLTTEDVVPRWIDRLYPREPQEFGMSSKVRSPTVRTQIGLNMKVRRSVCAPCNNGWMSALQNSTKPILEPLIRGHRQLLDRERFETLLTWAVMTAMVFEFHAIQVATPFFTAAERAEFARTQATPDRFVLLLGHRTEQRDPSAMYTHFNSIRFEEGRPPTPQDPIRGIAHTLIIGHVVLQWFFARAEGSSIDPTVAVADFIDPAIRSQMLLCAPGPTPVAFPPPRSMTPAIAIQFATRIPDQATL